MKKGYTPKTPFTPRTPYRQRSEKSDSNDSLQVYCRLKPLSPSENSCIKVISDTTVQLNVQDPNSMKSTSKQYTFKKIFTEAHTQKDIFNDVALPLVEKLITGKNSLLFTYGVTGSGKTFTMTGKKQNLGIMPQCLDVLFNSINDLQCQKFIFKPDRMNGFEVQTEEEARRDREEFHRKNYTSGKLRKKESQEDLLSARSKDSVKVTTVEEDNAYAVFISYVEVYNNYVYDLLENLYETEAVSKPQSKLIREDGANNMYIHGINEVEVKSTEEAFEIFYIGQKRKRMAQTTLNHDSSRSHSIFTIRLVQAPLDIEGETVLQEKHSICISQLSLVDLAGSERTSRTKNTGQRLNEASKINQSLMVLRKCFELLRENQQTNANKIVPYREQKITHLFKNFFEGDGDIRMVVCVNPSVTDADENLLVMQFAETSQDILTKPTPMKTDVVIGLTPGRRRANQAVKKVLQLADIDEHVPAPSVPDEPAGSVSDDKENDPSTASSNTGEEFSSNNAKRDVPSRNVRPVLHDTNVVYHLPKLPQIPDDVNCTEELAKAMTEYLNTRIPLVGSLRTDLHSRSSEFRAKLVKMQEAKLSAEREVETLKARLECDIAKTKLLEKKLISEDSCSEYLKKKHDELSSENQKLRNESNSLKRKFAEYSEEIKKLKKKVKLASEESPPENNVGSTLKARSVAVSNPRHNKTTFDSHDQWIDHRPAQPTPLNTVLQPVMSKRKSFEKVTSPKDVRKATKYCLMTQNQDQTGDIETNLYKGDVIPTSGGGAQVIFNDVETLKQSSPLNSPTSPKQTSLYPDIEAKCSMSLEGHSLKRKR